jgi:excisionase family DNA binding protein
MMDAADLAQRVPLEALDEVPAEHLPAVALYLAALQGRAAARSLAACPPTAAVPGNAAEALLDVREAALRLNVSVDWLYRHARRLPFTRRVGRAVRFDAAALARWLAHRAPPRV